MKMTMKMMVKMIVTAMNDKNEYINLILYLLYI